MNAPAETHDATSNLLVTIVDNAGVTRAKMVPPARVSSVARKGLGLSPAFAGMCVDDHVIPLRPDMAVGDMRLVPDLTARRRISPELDWAPVNQLSQNLEPMDTCTRSAAQRLQEDAASRGYEYKMAFEFEFTVFSGTDDGALGHAGPGYGLTAFLQLEPFMLELAEALASAGVEVEQIHPEYGNGQVEVSIAPSDPVTAADNAVITRIVVARTALRHKLRASFAPITAASGIGNGAHLHVSAMHEGSNVFADGEMAYGMTEAGLCMVSALVRTLPESIALFAPSVLGMDRLLPGMWSGAWVCWGLENREAGIRFIKGTVGHGQSSANCEVKVIEPAANPYLVVAAVVAITQDGISSGASNVDPVDTDPGSLTDRERASLGVGQLPGTLSASLDLLESNALLRKALGDELIDSFVGVHRYEDDTYSSLDLEKRIDLLRWRY